MRAKLEDRHRRIVELLSDGSEHRAEELALAVGVSLPTIRRDLEHLDQTGIVVRTHGGARSNEMGQFKPSYSDRMAEHRAEKLAVVRQALPLIRNQDTIALCNGTTTHYLARAIAQSGLEVTIVTNAIETALEMAACRRIRSILVGGEVSEGYTLGGFWSELMLKRAPRVDRVFLGADGIDLNHGLTAFYPNDASMHSQMAGLGREVVALVDHTKFGVVKTVPMLKLSEVHLVITDSGLDPATAERFRASGVRLQMAPASQDEPRHS